MRLMSRNDAITYAPEGIRVNAIHPGYIWTPMVEHHPGRTSEDPEAARAAAAAHPLGHMGEPEDVAWAALYLVSDKAKSVTGVELAIDGGCTARRRARVRPAQPGAACPDRRNARRICFSVSIRAKNSAPMPTISSPSASGTGAVPNTGCMKGR